jgi:hypothetical protein
LPSRVVRLFTQGEIDTMRWLVRTEAAPVPKIMSSLYSEPGVSHTIAELTQNSTRRGRLLLHGDGLRLNVP